MGATELDEPTSEDLRAIANWTIADQRRQYQAHKCRIVESEERFGNWRLGLGYRLDCQIDDEDEGVF